MIVLVLNAGSSTIKSHLYRFDRDQLPDEAPAPRWEGYVDWTISDDHGTLSARGEKETVHSELSLKTRAQDGGVSALLGTLTEGPTRQLRVLSEVDAVGHRVVHGGPDLAAPVLVTPEVKRVLSGLIPLAPEHNQPELAGIEAIELAIGEVPQVAVFDTAFHRTMPREAERYPLPGPWYERGIRRYGFHGISHQYCARRAAQVMGRPLESLRLISCHLGNGSSLAAVRGGRSVDTTMGFTPLEGLMMGSRSGSIDPSIVTHLIRHGDLEPDAVNQLLNRRSGLLGVSEISSDFRTVEAAARDGDSNAELAITMFVHRLQAGIGAMLPRLGGLDALIFTAGIGEHSARVREEACAPFEFLGLRLDTEHNRTAAPDTNVAATDSEVEVLVIRTREEWAIALECRQLLEGTG